MWWIYDISPSTEISYEHHSQYGCVSHSMLYIIRAGPACYTKKEVVDL